MTYLTKNLAFFSNLDGMQAICAEKMFAKNSPSQALPRQLPRRGSQAITLDAKVLSAMRKIPAVLLALPLRKDFPRSGGRCCVATKGGIWQSQRL